jgi:hypothetical protein
MEIIGGIEKMCSRIHCGWLVGRPTAAEAEAEAVGRLACRQRGVGQNIGGRAGYGRGSIKATVKVLHGGEAHEGWVRRKRRMRKSVWAGPHGDGDGEGGDEGEECGGRRGEGRGFSFCGVEGRYGVCLDAAAASVQARKAQLVVSS